MNLIRHVIGFLALALFGGLLLIIANATGAITLHPDVAIADLTGATAPAAASPSNQAGPYNIWSTLYAIQQQAPKTTVQLQYAPGSKPNTTITEVGGTISYLATGVVCVKWLYNLNDSTDDHETCVDTTSIVAIELDNPVF